MAFADVPVTSQNYRKGIVKNAPEHYTAIISDPMKISGSWQYGVFVSRDFGPTYGSSSSSGKSLKSYKMAGFQIWRKWEDCLDLQRLLEKEMYDIEKAKRKRADKASRIYPSNRAASFESLPCGSDTATIASMEGVPKLSRKASLFRASQAVVWKRQAEFKELIEWLFGSEQDIADDLRACKVVREWFSYWRGDKECEVKAPPRSAPINLPTLASTRSRQESISTVASSYLSSEDRSTPVSPEIRVSYSRPSAMVIQSRPLSRLTDVSYDSDEELDTFTQTIQTFPTPPPLEDEAIRALSPSLRKRAASSDQLSRLGLMAPVPEGVLPPPPAPADSASPVSHPPRAFLPAKLRHWQSLQSLRPQVDAAADSQEGDGGMLSQPMRRDPRNLSSHARGPSAHRNGMFISAPNTPNLGGTSEGGFDSHPRESFGSFLPSSRSSSSHLAPSFNLQTTKLSDRRNSVLTRSDSSLSKSSQSSGPARLPYAASAAASNSNIGLTDGLYSSVSTFSTDYSEPLEDDRLATTPLPRATSFGSTKLPDNLVNHIMLDTNLDGYDPEVLSQRSSGGMDLIDSYLYSPISPIEATPSEDSPMFSPFADTIPEKPRLSWISTDAEKMLPVVPDKDLPPSPPKDPEERVVTRRRARKESVHSSVSSPDQFPKAFQHRPAGQFHLPWSSPASPPRTPPGDDDGSTSQLSTFVVKACHAPTGCIVSFRAPRAIELHDLRARLAAKFMDSEGLMLRHGDDARLAYAPKRAPAPMTSRRNLSFTSLASPPSTAGSMRTRSDSGTSLSSIDLENLTYIHTPEDWASAMTTCTGKLTLHIVE